MTFKRLFVLFCVGVSFASARDDHPIVRTSLGIVEGYWSKSVDDRQYAAFDGIPYAEPPIEDDRFEESKPVKPWTGTWKAKTIHKCLQYNHVTESDPDIIVGKRRRLLIFERVYAQAGPGAFMWNSASSYGPKYIMNRDVVYVNLNYRLGPLGFLSTGDSVVPGNNGLKDQLLALKWIKRHVRDFGGNPDSLTLTGMSAGGASVHLHFLSPLSTGIFHRGFCQSGTALNPWVLAERSSEKAKKLADLVGCDAKDSRAMIECMKRRPGRQLVAAVKYFMPWLYNPFSPFGVVVDEWSKSPFLPEHPYALLSKRKTQHLPLIFSNVEAEGLYPAADFIGHPTRLDEIERNWEAYVPFILDFNGTVEVKDKDDVSRRIKAFYFGDQSVTVETFDKLVKMISDRLFIVDIEKAAKLHAYASDAPLYYYYFSYRGRHSKSETRARSNDDRGAAHADDTVYVLSSTSDMRSTKSDLQMSEIFLDVWTSFAVNGVPLVKNVDWKPVSREISAPLEFVHIRHPTDVRVEKSEDLGNGEFWRSLPIGENEKLFPEKNCKHDKSD